MDSTTIKALAGNTKAVLTNEKDLTSKKPSTFTASFSNIEKVYSLLPGKIIYIGIYKNTGTLAVAVSDYEIIRYLNIENIQVTSGETISKGRYLGTANKKYGLQFEYCSQWQGESVRPVRLENRTFFKQNPIDLLNGIYVPEYNKEIVRGYNLSDDVVKLTAEQDIEFSSNNGPVQEVVIDSSNYQITSLSEITPEILAELSNNY